MASFKNLVSTTSAQISSGGTITGDLVINGDLQVDGGGSLSFDEIIEGTSQVKVTNTSAFLVEKADGTDVFIVDTTNSRVGVGIAPTVDLDISSPSGDVQARLFRNANVKTSLTFKNSLQEWEIGNSVGDNNKFTIRDITDSRNAFVIDGSGNIGINTSPSDILDLKASDPHLRFIDSSDSDKTWRVGVANNEFRIQEDGVATPFKIAESSVDNSLIIDGDGNIGINTSTPQSKAHIDVVTQAPALTIDQSTENYNGGLRIRNNVGSSNDSNWDIYGSGSDLRIAHLTASNSSYPDLNTGHTNWLTITSAGYVGIGSQNTSPDTMLEIAGAHISAKGLLHLDSTDHSFIALDAHSSSHDSGIYFQENGTTQMIIDHDGSDNRMRFHDGSSTFMTISSTGNTTIYGNQFIEGTDAFLQFHDTGETASAGSGVHTILSADDKLKFMGREDDASAHVDGFSLLRTGDVQFHKTITIDSNATDGTALTIDSEAQDGQGIYMDVSQQTTGYGININDVGSSRTTGGIIYINSNQNNGGTRNLVHIINEHANATGTTPLFVKQDAAVQAVRIDQNGNGDGLLIATDATTRHGLYVDGSSFTTGNAAYIYSNASNTSTRNLMLIVNDHTGATGATGLKIQQDSTAPAMHINAGGNDVMKVDSNSRISLSNNDDGASGRTYNTVFGYLAGDDLANTGLYNSFFGDNSGHAVTVGDYNCAFGLNSLDGATHADRVTAIGSAALRGNVEAAAQGAVGVGYGALNGLTNGANTTGVGYEAGYAITVGDHNTVLGHTALRYEVGGQNSVAIGSAALYTQDGGDSETAMDNIGIGRNALYNNVTGKKNIAIGTSTGATGTNNFVNGNNNVFIGDSTTGSKAAPTNQIVIGQGEVGYGDNTASIGGTILGLNVPNTMSSPYYRLDGTNDHISIADNANLEPNTADYSYEILIKADDYTSQWFFSKFADGNNDIRLGTNSSDYLTFYAITGGSEEVDLTATATGGLTDGRWAHIVVVADRSGSGQFYVNGSAVGTTTTSMNANDTSNSANLTLGRRDSSYYASEMSCFRQFNKALTATEVKELYSGASVPFKYKGANQTNLTSGTLVKGKAYRITTYNSNDDFTNLGASSNATGVEFVSTGTTPTEWLHSSVLHPIGAVAEYDGSGITANKWYDKSGNELHGAVTGASDENTASAPVLSDNHPAFCVHPTSSQDNIAIDTNTDVVFGTERFDQGSNFASNTFTAPVTGKYQLNLFVRLNEMDSAAAFYMLRIETSNDNYQVTFDPDFGQDTPYFTKSLSVLADMDVNDTAKVVFFQSSGTAQTDIDVQTFFSGYLVC